MFDTEKSWERVLPLRQKYRILILNCLFTVMLSTYGGKEFKIAETIMQEEQLTYTVRVLPHVPNYF